MKIRKYLSLMAATSLIGLSFNSQAGSADEIKALNTKIERLERVLDKVIEGQESAPIITLNKGFSVTSADKAYSFAVDGFVQADVVWTSDDETDLTTGTTVKRARLGVKGTIDSGWKYRVLTDFGNDDFKLVDANISYTGIKGTKITLGQFKEPYSLEQLMSAKYWTFAEKASMAALTPKRAMGLGITHQYSKGLISAGLFGENLNKKRNDDEGYGLAGRLTYVPVQDENNLLHLGISASHKKIDSETNAITYKSTAENTVTSAFVNTGKISDVSDVTTFTPELAFNLGSLGFQAEYTHAALSRESGDDLSFDGYYAEASYFLTGEARNYNKKKGVFSKTKPNKPFKLKDDGYGAWQIAYRYSVLDLNDKNITGGKMQNHTIGVNWHPTSNVRFAANIINSTTDANASLQSENPTIFMLRTQFEF